MEVFRRSPHAGTKLRQLPPWVTTDDGMRRCAFPRRDEQVRMCMLLGIAVLKCCCVTQEHDGEVIGIRDKMNSLGPHSRLQAYKHSTFFGHQ
jgi:hypothetical protein